MADLDALEAVARGATQGAWGQGRFVDQRQYSHWSKEAKVHAENQERQIVRAGGPMGEHVAHTHGTPNGPANLAHIATFDPPTVLELIALLRKQDAALQAVREACDRIIELAPEPDEFSEDVGHHYDMGRADLATDIKRTLDTNGDTP